MNSVNQEDLVEGHNIFLATEVDDFIKRGGVEALLAILSDESVEAIVEYVCTLEDDVEDE